MFKGTMCYLKNFGCPQRIANMRDKIQSYQEAGRRAVQFQLQHQKPDGCFIWDEKIRDAYHKQTYSWSLAGESGAAHKLLSWMKANTLQPDGQLRDYNGDVYKHAWLLQGAHRLGRFDVSCRVMDFLASCQTASGGWPLFTGDELCRMLPTAWAGVAAVYMGRMDVAEKAAGWCVSLLEQQEDETKFYYQMTQDGHLVTLDESPSAAFIAAAKPQQPYWEVGLPQMLMCRMYMATGDETYRDRATRFFEWHSQLAEDRFTHTGSGKTSLANAVYCQVTGDDCARDAVIQFCDRLLETQLPEGSWRVGSGEASLLTRIDAAAEFNVWLQEDSAILSSMV